MKRLIYTLLICLLFSNCTHRIVRTGYQIDKSDYRNCEVIIRRDVTISDTLAKKIGEIKLGETGFAIVCSENHAINILRREACAINADLIVITEENRPDLWSSCYRCRAEFYKYNNIIQRQNQLSDDRFSNTEIQKRVKKDRGTNTLVDIGLITIGVVLLILVYT